MHTTGSTGNALYSAPWDQCSDNRDFRLLLILFVERYQLGVQHTYNIFVDIIIALPNKTTYFKFAGFLLY